MDKEWDMLIEALDQYLAENGEQELTNESLLRIMIKINKRIEDQNYNSELKVHNFDIFKQ